MYVILTAYAFCESENLTRQKRKSLVYINFTYCTVTNQCPILSKSRTILVAVLTSINELLFLLAKIHESLWAYLPSENTLMSRRTGDEEITEITDDYSLVALQGLWNFNARPANSRWNAHVAHMRPAFFGYIFNDAWPISIMRDIFPRATRSPSNPLQPPYDRAFITRDLCFARDRNCQGRVVARKVHAWLVKKKNKS